MFIMYTFYDFISGFQYSISLTFTSGALALLHCIKLQNNNDRDCFTCKLCPCLQLHRKTDTLRIVYLSDLSHDNSGIIECV